MGSVQITSTRIRLPPWVSPAFIVGGTVLLFWLAATLFPSWMAPYDPLNIAGRRLQPPSSAHLLGTDALGRDVLSRTLYGAQHSLPIAFIVVFSAVVIGSAAGAISGYRGGLIGAAIVGIALFALLGSGWARLPIIVAVNKIDLPEANPDRVMSQLSELGLTPEAWGGTTIFCQISALQKRGIPELLDAILLQAEVLELTANYDSRAEAKVVESRVDQGRGIVSTVIVERGTLRIGDSFAAGIYSGKVRALFNDKGERIEEATPSMPVEVIGFEGLPNAGDPFEVVEDEKYARQISMKRQELKKYEESKNVKKVTLDNLYSTIQQGDVQELKVIIKGDVQGSVEALKGLLEKLSTPEVRLNVIRSAAGTISEDDVNMAAASEAIIIAFNVRPSPAAKLLADREKVDIRKYNIIYRAEEEIKKAMEGMLAPELKESEIGQVEVRETFQVPKVGVVAGCFVLEGCVRRNCQVRVIREGVEIHQGKINSLKRFKDDAKEVAAGYECGIGIEGLQDVKAGDTLEIYEMIEIARTLSAPADAGKANGRDQA